MIVRMTKIEIAGPRKQIDAITETVQALGVLHLEEMPLAVEGAEASLHRMHLGVEQSKRYRVLSEIRDAIQPAVALVQPAGREGAGPSRETIDAIASLEVTELRHRALFVHKPARGLLRREANLRDDLEVIAKYEKLLAILGPAVEKCAFADDFDLKGILIETDAKAALKALRKQLAQITDGHYELHATKMGGGRRAAVLAVPAEHADEVATMLWRRGVSEISFPVEFEQLPLREGIAAIAERARQLPARLRKLDEEKARFIERNTAEVLAIAKICSDGLARLDELAKAVHTECVFALRGWLPEKELGRFQHTLHEQFGETVVVQEIDTSQVHGTEVPVKLRNNRFFRPFELLLSIFPLPTYGTLDPTVLVAVGFTTFFALILGDIGYGVILLLLAVWFRKKFGHNQILRDVGFVAIATAVTTIGFGIFFGEIFGNLGTPIFGHHWPFERETIQQPLMTVCIGIGVVHIFLSLVLGIVAAARERATRHMLERIGMTLWFLALLLGTGLILEIVTLPSGWVVTGILVAASWVLIIVGHWLSMFELLSIFTNVLSYIRLFAFGLASVEMANLANGMPAMVDNVAIGVTVAFFLHALNFGLGIFEPTIQTLRLHYVEFLPKFYNPEGRNYEPLREQEVYS